MMALQSYFIIVCPSPLYEVVEEGDMTHVLWEPLV